MRSGRPVARLADETKADVIRRIHAGEFRCDIARACDVSEYAVTDIAEKNGLTIAKCRRGSRWGKFKKPVSVDASPTEQQKWRGALFNARWGGGYAR